MKATGLVPAWSIAMKSLCPRFLTSFALTFAALTAASSAATVAISDLLASPSAHDGQHVDVSGTISHLVQKTSHKGNPYVTFSLCSSQCIHVFAFGSPSISDGQTITVHGTFAAVKHTGSYTFYNEIDADDGSL
jgi:hypothetical protein